MTLPDSLSEPVALFISIQTWPLWRRWLLNCGTAYLGLYFLALGQTMVLLLPAPLRLALADAFSRSVLQSPLPGTGVTSSGDTARDWVLALLCFLLSLLLGTVWTVLQPRRIPAWQLPALSVFVRLTLIFWLLIYGSSKFDFSQFGLLPDAIQSQTYSDSSPMGLLWRFMAFSPGYQYLAGVAECLPALLLLHRRTVTLGALIAAVTLTNVFALNMFYDVPVKLFSVHLLLAALVLLTFDAARLGSFLAGRVVAAQSWPHSRRKIWLISLSWLMTALLVAYLGFHVSAGLTAYRQDQAAPLSPIKARGFHWVNEYKYNK